MMDLLQGVRSALDAESAKKGSADAFVASLLWRRTFNTKLESGSSLLESPALTLTIKQQDLPALCILMLRC